MSETSIFQSISDWMFRDALPFWSEHGADAQFGGFIEALTFAGEDAACPFKRTRVACRQVYVFSHAKILGWSESDHLIHHGLEYLVEKAWQGETGGFARRLARAGGVDDATPDLYDHAFALFAFAWAYRATGESVCRDWAARTLEWIEAHLRHPSDAGYWHARPPNGPRQQNPHMHLLEASLAAFEATKDARYKACGLNLIDLFRSRFFNPVNGALTEYFEDDWTPVSGEQGTLVEPGHQFEWAWILQNCHTQWGVQCHEEMRALIAFAERHGLDPQTGAVMNAVGINGAPRDAGSRAWPNTERMKAAVALRRCDQTASLEPLRQSAQLLLERYLASHEDISIPRGAWIDAFDARGAPTSKSVPASTFYHLFLAFAAAAAIAPDDRNI